MTPVSFDQIGEESVGHGFVESQATNPLFVQKLLITHIIKKTTFYNLSAGRLGDLQMFHHENT
jgi:hypothetical protein